MSKGIFHEPEHWTKHSTQGLLSHLFEHRVTHTLLPDLFPRSRANFQANMDEKSYKCSESWEFNHLQIHEANSICCWWLWDSQKLQNKQVSRPWIDTDKVKNELLSSIPDHIFFMGRMCEWNYGNPSMCAWLYLSGQCSTLKDADNNLLT